MTLRLGIVAAVSSLGIAEWLPAQYLDRLLPERDPGGGPAVELPTAPPGGGAFAGSSEVLIEILDGIDFESDAEIPKPNRLQGVLSSFVGRPMTLGDLEAIIDTVVAHYQKHHFSAVEVLVPEQEVTDGRIAITIVPGRAGDVVLSGGKHLDRERLARSIRVASGDLLKTPALQSELDWLNRNPFHGASLLVAPGAGIAEADLLFQFSDRRPMRLFGGFENSGVEIVGEYRWLAGMEWGDAFGLGHHLVYQTTLGTDLDEFRAHAGAYRIPLPWRHELEIIGGYVKSSATHTDESGAPSDDSGTSWLLGGHYSVPLPRFRTVWHEISLGFDFKHTDTDLLFGGDSVFDTAAQIAQWSLRYSASQSARNGNTSFVAEWVVSPGNLNARNSDEAFREINPDADSTYTYLRGTLRRVRRLPGDAALVAMVGGQWSDTGLLPSEQLALGGYDTVRGYPEREGLGDIGYHGSLELRSPPFAIVPKVDDSFQVLAFADYGRAWAAERDRSEDLEFSSAGPGIRYQLADHASFRVDYAWRLDGSGGSRVHFGMNLEF